MNRSPLMTTAFAGLALMTCLSANAQTARNDLLTQCPDLAEQLPDTLASTLQREGRDGRVRVELLAGGGGPTQIAAIDGPRAYQSAVRRALNGLDCRLEAQSPQRFVLTIDFQVPGAGRLPLAQTPAPSTYAQAPAR